MANDIVTTLVGNLTADPDLRYTQNGRAVANFTIAQTPRHFDKNTNEWKNEESVFLRASAWGDLAEHAATSFRKGQQVVAVGRLKQHTYQDKNTGDNRTAYDFDVDEIASSVRYGTTVFTKSASNAQNAEAAAVAPAKAPAAPAPVAASAPSVATAPPAEEDIF